MSSTSKWIERCSKLDSQEVFKQHELLMEYLRAGKEVVSENGKIVPLKKNKKKTKMPARVGCNPEQGEDKIKTSSPDFEFLVTGHSDGTLSTVVPSTFYEGNPTFNQKYTFKAVQNAWANAKRVATSRIQAQRSAAAVANPATTGTLEAAADAVLDDVKPAASPTKRSHDMSDTVMNGEDVMDWNPVHRMWTFETDEGQEMVGLRFALPSGASPNGTDGFDIEASGTEVKITVDWPEGMYETDNKKAFRPNELEDPITQRLLAAEKLQIVKILKKKDKTPRACVRLELPFPVVEVRNPWMTLKRRKTTGGCVVITRFKSVVETTFQTKEEKDYDDY